ncbi:ATP-binding protein [Glutamicibacter sp.]|uniref:ATP-binding protein n=1 Tax=Glutamicibacter sp. TaxID=1931995 RepID=UPI0028BD4B80|nr:ATP-binding protein [Glutamicibacter sp.]
MTLDIVMPIQPAPALDHAQWRIESLQMANWGGFHGRHDVKFSPGSTLMSGASGTGKSTVLDAYLALMMPSDIPFNGASNDAGGRARSADQRNLLSYLRGKMDANSVDGTGEMRDQVLRGGDGEPIWGALAGTFINDGGRRYTVARFYFAKSGASVTSDVTTTYAAFEGYLDISRLEPLASARFEKRALKTSIPGLTTFNTFREFEATIHTRLDIGGGDGGRKAMRLLARVQAGMEVKRVDGLYKTMVLEQPITYEAADTALMHFADLEASYTKMVDAANKEKALARLPELQNELTDAETTTQIISQFGADLEGPSPFRLWRLRTERALLDAAVAENRTEHGGVLSKLVQAKAEESQYEERLAQIGEEKRSNGGEAIDERKHEIARLERSQGQVHMAFLRFQTRTENIDLVVPESAEQFVEAQCVSAEFLAGFEERERALQAEEDAAQLELAPLTSRQLDLLDEKRSLANRKSAVPKRMHLARVAMAEAAGLDPETQLPFVAELIDVLPDEAHWRTAVENTLGGIARTLLIDGSIRDRFSAAIDGLRISPRLNYDSIQLKEHQEWRGNPSYISGKLAFKNSPFSAWVQERVSGENVDHLCVPDSGSLSGPGARVTPSGQTRNGSRGAHGESSDGNIIGFSNERRLADIEMQLAALDPQIGAVQSRIKAIRTRLSSLRLQRDAHRFVVDTEWASIDRLGLELQISGLEAEIQRLRAANSILDALEAEEERIKPLSKESMRVRVLAEERLKALTKQHGDLVSEQDMVQDGIDAMVVAQTAAVTDAQQAYLDDLFAANWDATDLKAFNANTRALRKRLSDEILAARQRAHRATSSMESMFEGYKARWDEHNLGTAAVSADGYREILDKIRSEGLHERRDRWRRELAAWSSDDLLGLNDAFDLALEDIEERLKPINRILENLPFGGKGVLQIKSRRLQSDDLIKFRRGLRELSSGLALEMSDQQIMTRFTRLREFMTRITIPEGRASTSQRDRYLDVRQHVVITAVVLDDITNRREIATHDSLGGKSGGETQELVAFIVGSALRYQLGDETRSRPRFAPVFLDEGFVKSDSEFAGRSVRAWQDLGFQLVIGAPLDKVTALEPHMDLLLTVTKNERGYSFVVDLQDAPDAEDAR